MSNKCYDILKAIGQFLLPALMAFTICICEQFNLEPEIVSVIFAAFIEFYNGVMQFIRAGFFRENIIIPADEGQEEIEEFEEV